MERKIKAKQTVFLNYLIDGNNYPFNDNLNLSINPQQVIVKEICYSPSDILVAQNAIVFIRSPMIKERNQILGSFQLQGTQKRSDTVFDCYDAFSTQSFDLVFLNILNKYERVDNTTNYLDGQISIILEFIEYHEPGLQNAVVMPPTQIPKIWQSNMPVQNPNNQIGLY